MRFKFCPICGKALVEKYSWDEGGVPYCDNDDMMFFDTPKPCVIVAVIKDQEILLLKQSYIFKNSKVLVSGYVTCGETVEDTVRREVLEETGIEVGDIKYLGSEYLESREIIMLTYMAKYEAGEIKKSDEVESLGWTSLDDALCDMSEDVIGKRIVKKVFDEINYDNTNAFRCELK